MRRSARLQDNFNQSVGVDKQFWENVQNPVDIEMEHSCRQAEAVAAAQHMTTNNLCMFQEDTRVSNRENRHCVGEPNHFEFSVIFCYNTVTFFISATK